MNEKAWMTSSTWIGTEADEKIVTEVEEFDDGLRVDDRINEALIESSNE